MSHWAFPGQHLVTGATPTGDLVVSSKPDENVVSHAFGGEVKITYGLSTQTGTSEVHWLRRSHVEFEPDEPAPIEQLTERFSVPMQRFLTFACGAPTHLRGMTVTSAGQGMDVNGTWLPKNIQVGYGGWRKPSDEKAPTQMRLPLVAIRDRFEETLRAWDLLHEEQERSMALLFAISLGKTFCYLTVDFYLPSRRSNCFTESGGLTVFYPRKITKHGSLRSWNPWRSVTPRSG